MKSWRPWWPMTILEAPARFISRYHFQSRCNWNYKSLSVAKKPNKGDWSFLLLFKTKYLFPLNYAPKGWSDLQHQIRKFTWWWALYCFWWSDVLFCFVIFSLFYFLYNLFLESNFVLWSDGSIQLCQFNFHSWQFDRLFVPKLVYHETLFLQLKILSKLDGTEQIREKNRRSFHLHFSFKLYPNYAYVACILLFIRAHFFSPIPLFCLPKSLFWPIGL